ncbi:MAG: DUF1611 domain-containing protein [Phycisphaerales bacterium]|nr:DUF1611 domain-containing protein [Phycisphaerales bacterium]
MNPRRICILTDGHLDTFTAKTALGLLRYCPDEVVAVLDRQHVGESLFDLVGTGKDIPIIGSIDAAKQLSANQLLMGVALPGGQLPVAWREFLEEGLQSGMDIVSGMHARLNHDERFAQLAKENGRTLYDVRNPGPPPPVGSGKAAFTKAKRILTVGSDCNVGKRVTALEITRELKSRDVNVEFLATGQTGIMISGSGVPADAVISDFLTGYIERGVLERGDADYVLVEGQGSILNPAFSPVTLGLIHGAMPDAMIICHHPPRKNMRATEYPVAGLRELIDLHEAITKPLYPSKVIAVALNCFGMDPQAADDAVRATQELTGLPAIDPIRMGASGFADLILAL